MVSLTTPREHGNIKVVATTNIPVGVSTIFWRRGPPTLDREDAFHHQVLDFLSPDWQPPSSDSGSEIESDDEQSWHFVIMDNGEADGSQHMDLDEVPTCFPAPRPVAEARRILRRRAQPPRRSAN